MSAGFSNRWHGRAAVWLDSAAAWAQDKGVWRWVGFGLGALLVAAWWIGLRRMPGADGTDVHIQGYQMGYGLLCFAMLVAGVVMMAPILAPWVAGPLLRWIDGIYLGGSSIERPPLTYVVAERRLLERRFEDAAIEFERLALWHPREVRPYVDGIRSARLAGDEKLARRLFRRGSLRCPQALDQLRTSLSTASPIPPASQV